MISPKLSIKFLLKKKLLASLFVCLPLNYTPRPFCVTQTPVQHIKLQNWRVLQRGGHIAHVLVGDVGPIVCDMHRE
jgi:hypothetical protein